MRLIFRAAELGGNYACALAAAITASGMYAPADWAGALDHLQRSAELGYGPAREQLRLLARRPGQAGSGSGAWQRLRRSVDIEAWRTPPEARALSSDPSIRVVERFVPAGICDWIIARAKDRLAPAQVYDAGALKPRQSDTRTNSFAGFDLVNLDLVMLMVRERLAAAAGLPVLAMEAPQVFHYAVGQTFAEHFDFLDSAIPGQAQGLAKGGQRVATLLVYLNAGFEGGETDFPLLGLKFRGQPGDALMFTNVEPGGAPDRRMLHAGLPPTSGEKWLLSQWVRDRVPPGVGGRAAS